MRLIDADKMDANYTHSIDFDGNTDSLVDDINDWVAEQPTIDAEPVVHGRWIILCQAETTAPCCRKDKLSDYPTCTRCGGYNIGGKTAYCPNCGAKMDEEEE